MNMVQQTPDGVLIVRKDGSAKDYVDTFANAALDYGVATPTLVAGAIDRTYEPGLRHCQTNGKDILAGGPLAWTPGDNYISGIAAALAAQTARQPPPTGPTGVMRDAK
jgi:hypothetical protein